MRQRTLTSGTGFEIHTRSMKKMKFPEKMEKLMP
jgi:hypothetical protein